MSLDHVCIEFTRIDHVPGGGGGHFCGRVAQLPARQGLLDIFNHALLKLKSCTAHVVEEAILLSVQHSGFRVQGSAFRVQGSGFRIQDSAFRVPGSGFRVQGSG